jgi:hypothetical protein
MSQVLCHSVLRPAGFRTVLAVHGVAICFYLGPSRTASLTFKVALATAGYKFCEVLVNSAPGEVRRARWPAGFGACSVHGRVDTR